MVVRRISTSCLVLSCLTLGTVGVWGQPAAGSARDMFRKASSRFGKPAAEPEVRAEAKKPTPVAPVKKPPQPVETAKSEPRKATPEKPAEAAGEKKSSVPLEPVGGASVTLVSSTTPPALEPLGLRYSLVKQAGDSIREVDADTVFRSGERIKLHFQASDHAYLYLVLKGSSGRWKVLFPSAEIAGGDNRVEPETTYVVPNNPKAWFAFDQQVGEEQLFILLSRKPQPDLERMIYDLRRSSRPSTSPQTPAPAAEPATGGKVMLASAERHDVDDVMIAGLRQTAHSRDLVFEKVEDDQQEPEWKKAVYIVDKDASPDARLVADIKLKHQ
ncbi:MAG: DUF4384 domain-containing protein [Acidobacteria bacterium]|nr:DUF4384 domain-containing protein [Acidobacteriota bacterium]